MRPVLTSDDVTFADIVTRRLISIQLQSTRLAVTAACRCIMRHTSSLLETRIFIRTIAWLANVFLTILIRFTGMPACTAIFSICRQVHAFRRTLRTAVFIASFTRIDALASFTRHIVRDI